MVSFNIFGCCVSRDSLALLEQVKKACTLQLVSGTTTLSAFSEKADRTYTIDDFKDYKGTNFYKRITLQELNKTSLDYLFEKKSDYLIIDLMNNHLKLYKKGNHFLCIDSFYRDNKERFNNDFHLDKYEIVNIEDLTFDDYIPGLNKLCNIVLKHYSPNRIIVNKIKGAQFYVEGARKKAFNQVVFDHVSFYNNLIGKMYEYIETKLCGCHIIDYIDNVLSVNPHKWGTYHLHFHDLYYQYDAKAIELICKNLPYDKEILQLEELRQTYIEKFELLNLKLEMTAKNDSIKWATNAVNFTQNLLMDVLSDEKFYKNLRKIKEQNLTVSILKSADIAGRVLLKALYKYEIPVIFQTSVSDFIFMNEEDFEKCRQANLIISANVHENKYLEKDGIKAILISDLLK